MHGNNFYLTTDPTCRRLLLLWMFYSKGGATFQLASWTGIGQGKWTFEIVSKEVLWEFYQTIWSPPFPNITRHSEGWPYTVTSSIYQTLHLSLMLLLSWTLLPNLTSYLIARGFHRAFATAAACQQRTLTPRDTWSCPTFGFACVLMLRPISPELVLFRTFEFRTSLVTSILLCKQCVREQNLVWISLWCHLCTILIKRHVPNQCSWLVDPNPSRYSA